MKNCLYIDIQFSERVVYATELRKMKFKNVRNTVKSLNTLYCLKK